ncbi:MAG TPA: 4-hydroxythreonine-4-phosphate dehydrogenase PdxA [Ignavibacteriales bacterium]|nr:4-hydroxythreonine-4-phosphate dehydrogenase PdxA [Ignavibacteriales bacterium]
MNKFVFTCGDINGIGPEIVQKALNRVSKLKGVKLYYLCPAEVFERISEKIAPQFDYEIINHLPGHKAEKNSRVCVINIKTGKLKLETGRPTAVSGQVSFKAIRQSFEIASSGLCDAIVTAPISKEALGMAGIDFPGHTEMYAAWSGVKDYVMMFFSSKMKCALLTIHEPIKKVPKLITEKRIQSTLRAVVSSLRNDFNIQYPEVAVLGLNPHAGENGRIGSEEIDTIIPALKTSGFSEFLRGPFVPDAFFANKLYKKYDLVLGMYHDQVLIPFKLLNFSSGVNYTAGLPIVRTSPDHGTAFDIADRFIADEGSIMEAFHLAKKIAQNRRQKFHGEKGQNA